ncbi:MAG: SMP-30/gluconolactonase/LRE family protein, partial [Limisphaerales bacterium]
GERYMEMRAPVNRPESGGDGMTVDREGRAFVTSHVGIQMFDATGRLGGVISKPSDKACVSVGFAGPDRSWLYACASDKIFRRRTLTTPALSLRRGRIVGRLSAKPSEAMPQDGLPGWSFTWIH